MMIKRTMTNHGRAVRLARLALTAALAASLGACTASRVHVATGDELSRHHGESVAAVRTIEGNLLRFDDGTASVRVTPAPAGIVVASAGESLVIPASSIAELEVGSRSADVPATIALVASGVGAGILLFLSMITIK
jgi:hypothetical protein